MQATHRIIVHGLMKVEDKYLVIKRTSIKRGKTNSYPEYWDLPGGMVEYGELPVSALVREVKEEVNLEVKVKKVIHEDSNYDEGKNIVFTRLVYLCEVINNDISNIILQLDEHSQYKLIESLDEMKDELFVEYVIEVFKGIE